jgi:hypothetical protein
MPKTHRDAWTFVLCDGLEKVFADEAPRPMDQSIAHSVFLGETASFQVAFLPPSIDQLENLGELQFEVLSGGAFTSMSSVGLVPCSLVAYDNPDEGYLRTTPGLYPDLLRPITDGRVAPILAAQWQAVWFDLVATDPAHAGEHTVTIRVTSTQLGEVVFTGEVVITVLPQTLPELDIPNTHWFHCDGLASYYGVEVFSEEHWRIIENFIAKAAKADINSLLTPVWTPPLDTAIGGLRTPTQLVDIAWEDGRYSFGFDKLIRWLDIFRRHGMRYVEVAHFFTQWGALKTPAIYVTEGGVLHRRFGWDVDATDPRYRELLEQLVPALTAVLAEHWDLDRVIYHISDEPTPESIESYSRAKAVVADLLSGGYLVDALSDYEFYETGAVSVPVVASDAVKPFIENSVEGFWTYYCVAQSRNVANRFIGLPSLRNRVLGWHLFAFDVSGFLQWGYNFYNNQESKRPIDPFLDTSVGGVFPAGDSFLVYPGEDGRPLESIRFRVFAMAMADYRAMRHAAARVGKKRVMELVDPDGTLAFDRFSYDPNHYRRVREAVNALIVG